MDVPCTEWRTQTIIWGVLFICNMKTILTDDFRDFIKWSVNIRSVMKETSSFTASTRLQCKWAPLSIIEYYLTLIQRLVTDHRPLVSIQSALNMIVKLSSAEPKQCAYKAVPLWIILIWRYSVSHPLSRLLLCWIRSSFYLDYCWSRHSLSLAI